MTDEEMTRKAVEKAIADAVKAMGDQKAVSQATGISEPMLSMAKARGSMGLTNYLKLIELGKRQAARAAVAILTACSLMTIGYAPESHASSLSPSVHGNNTNYARIGRIFRRLARMAAEGIRGLLMPLRCGRGSPGPIPRGRPAATYA